MLTKLDFTQPAAIMLMGMLGHVGDPAEDDDAYTQSGAVPYRARRRDQIVRFFDGLELVDPGIVQLRDWRPEPGRPGPRSVPALGGIGKKVSWAAVTDATFRSEKWI